MTLGNVVSIISNHNLLFCAETENISINLNRFDPGTLSSSSEVVPQTLLPNDVIVPMQMIRKTLSDKSNRFCRFSNTHLKSAFKVCIYIPSYVYLVQGSKFKSRSLKIFDYFGHFKLGTN